MKTQPGKASKVDSYRILKAGEAISGTIDSNDASTE